MCEKDYDVLKTDQPINYMYVIVNFCGIKFVCTR